MGNNTVESGESKGTKSPLFSSGTPEMDTSNAQGDVSGPKKAKEGDMSNATVHTFEK